MIKILFILMCLTISDASAEKISFSIGDGNATASVKAEEAKLYNFSDKLIEAATNCSVYHEDFTLANPELSNFGAMFGGAKFEVLVDINGTKDDKCEFDITQHIAGIGGQKYICAIDKKTQEELLEAMKSRSTEIVTQTFTTYSETDVMGNTGKLPVEQTVTDTIFNVTISKIFGNYCSIKEIKSTREEQEQSFYNMLKFSDKFIGSLKTCSPDKEEFTFVVMYDYAKIIGKKDQICHIQTSDFDIYAPNDMLSELTGFDKLYSLLEDKDNYQYKAFENYSLSSVLSFINNCKESPNNGLSTNSFMDAYKKITSISASHNDENCTLNIINKLEINGVQDDYSIVCNISDKNRDIILEKYSTLLNSDSNDNDEEIRKAGRTILASLVKSNLCQRVF